MFVSVYAEGWESKQASKSVCVCLCVCACVCVCVFTKKKRRGKIRTMFMFAYFGRAFLYMLKSWQKSVVQR